MRIEYRKRKHDGLLAIWKHQPSDEVAGQWVCIAVCGTVEGALERMLQERAVASG